MSLPLLGLGGAAIGAAFLADERQKRLQLERDRLLGRAPKQAPANRAMLAVHFNQGIYWDEMQIPQLSD